jgi:hypothetical protein
LRAQGAGMHQLGFGTIALGRTSLRHVTSVVTTGKWSQKTGLEKFPQAGITRVPGLFSYLFNVAASRPAQITTG